MRSLRSLRLLALLLPPATPALGCSSGSGQPVSANEAGRTTEAGPAATWSNSMQTNYASFCVRCHGATSVSAGMQNFSCLNWYQPAADGGPGKCVDTGTMAADVPGVAQFKHIMICGLWPSSSGSPAPSCPDPAFSVPCSQFPADCSTGATVSAKCPSVAQREAMIAWLNAGTPP